MGDRLLTRAEKRAIRKLPCGKCGAVPPYADGSWTQKHRLKPGSKGGKYTLKNTVPRCPKCHTKEPGHVASGLILLPFAKRQAAGRKRRGKAPWNKGTHGLQVAWNKGKRDYMSAEGSARISASSRRRRGYRHTVEAIAKMRAAALLRERRRRDHQAVAKQ